MPDSEDPNPLLPLDEILDSDPDAWQERAEEIGRSRENRPISGLEIGRGTSRVTLIAGCHADEPIGPALLRRLAGYLSRLGDDDPLLHDHTWRIVPHVNPDGEERNRRWTSEVVDVTTPTGRTDQGYDLFTYLRSAVRELPGDDIEFGFPEGGDKEDQSVRPENRAVARFLARSAESPGGRIRLHGSLHGMGLSPGPWFLVDPSWVERTATLRRRLARAAATMGYRLFDAERRGEKGFHRIEPGFATRPSSRAMREFFLSRGEPEMASKFRPNSMEFARMLGGDPLTIVPEMPLFLVASLLDGPLEPAHLEAVRRELTLATSKGHQALAETAESLGITPMPLSDQMSLQLLFVAEALRVVRTEDAPKSGT